MLLQKIQQDSKISGFKVNILNLELKYIGAVWAPINFFHSPSENLKWTHDKIV